MNHHETNAKPESLPIAERDNRDTCYACFRPRSHCYCGQITQVSNRTEIILIQHPRERFHPIGTARIAALGLERVRLEVNSAHRLERGPGALKLPEKTGLLYPAPDAQDLSELSPEQRPKHLVVLDGTWHHAHTLYRDIPALAGLPRYAFKPQAPSEYRLRREPHADFVSTIEAIVHCLKLLEPTTVGLDGLLETFRAMIDRQIASRRSNAVHRSKKDKRPQATRNLPRALTEDFARAVLVYAETFSPPLPPGMPPAPMRGLVHLVAKRLHGGAVFEGLRIPEAPIPQLYLDHMKLNAEQLRKGLRPAELESQWRAFLKPTDTLIAWNQGTLARVERCLPWRGQHAFLKAAYHCVGSCRGALEDIVKQEGLTPKAPQCSGRAGERLANAEALSQFLHQRRLRS